MNKRAIFILTILFSFVLCDYALSQQAQTNIQYQSSILVGEQSSLPFWLYANRDGTVDSSGTNWLNAVHVDRLLLSEENIKIRAGATAIGRISNNRSAHISELFVHADFGSVRFSFGRFADPIGFYNHELSSGSIMVSRNAPPIPKISIATPDFISIPYTDDELQFKGMFSHGWLEGDRYVQNAFIHQKYLYLRLKLGAFSATGGLVHNVVWGGTHPEFGKLPSSFGDFLRVVAGQNASNRETTPVNETRGVIGNSVAAYDFGLQYEFDQLNLSFGRMYYLEASAAPDPIFDTPWDGSWTLNIALDNKRSLVNGFTYEYINTKQSSASGESTRRDNYYNNGIYLSGWTYMGRVLGNPLFLYNKEIPRITNNIFLAHHIGINGYIDRNFYYKILGAYSRNYGNDYLEGQELEQLSAIVTVRYELPSIEGLSLFTSLALDSGDLYEQSAGFEIGFTFNP